MHLRIRVQSNQRGGRSLLSNDCNLRVGPEQRWARESASTRPSSETCGDLFGFNIHFHFLVPLSLSTGKEYAPAVPALSGFPRPDVEKPPTDLPLHPGANSFMFEDFENFEEF